MATVHHAARGFMKMLRPGRPRCGGRVHRQVRVIQPLTADRAAIAAAIKSTQPRARPRSTTRSMWPSRSSAAAPRHRRGAAAGDRGPVGRRGHRQPGPVRRRARAGAEEGCQHLHHCAAVAVRRPRGRWRPQWKFLRRRVRDEVARAGDRRAVVLPGGRPRAEGRLRRHHGRAGGPVLDRLLADQPTQRRALSPYPRPRADQSEYRPRTRSGYTAETPAHAARSSGCPRPCVASPLAFSTCTCVQQRQQPEHPTMRSVNRMFVRR